MAYRLNPPSPPPTWAEHVGGRGQLMMRKRYRVLILAAIVASVVVPVGFALSLESGTVVSHLPGPVSIAASTVVAKPALIDTGRRRALSGDWSQSDPLKLLMVGSLFLGVAAIVRRSV